jgi:hypothetical protein
MKLKQRMPPATLLVLAVMSLPLGSQAGVLTTQHGSVCKPYGWSSTSEIYRNESGTWNFSSGMRSLVCPLTRVGEVSTGGLVIWIDGYAPAGGTVTCTVLSLAYTGVLLAYEAVSFTGTGTSFDKAIVLPQDKVPMYSIQAVVCDLPPAGGIYDVEPGNL